MKSYEVRIKGVSEGLTAQERALLVLRSWKEGKEEEPAWRYTMPDEQVPAFNRLINKMNGVNRQLGLYLFAVHLEADKLNLRMGWLATMALWGVRAWELGLYVACETKETVTESEHRKLVDQARAEFAPVAELADLLAYRYTDWEEADAESWGGPEGLIIKDKSWARLCREKERELAKLVAEGVLQGKGSGRRLKVNAGSFYDWLGEEAPAFPGWGFGFDVLPDDQAQEAARRRKERDEAQKALAACPGLTIFQEPSWPEELKEATKWRAKGELDELIDLHKEILRQGIEKEWRELRAVEAMVAEAQEAFDGEDPCVPEVRHSLDHTKERLADLHQSLLAYVEPFELPEPDEETLAEVRALYEREGR